MLWIVYALLVIVRNLYAELYYAVVMVYARLVQV